MHFISCAYEQHAAAILEILNDAILNSTALYDYQPRSLSTMADWFELKAANHFPVIGITDDEGVLLGFASYGSFRTLPGYKYTVEHSVYVHREHRGSGIGKLLMEHLISAAREQQCHVMIGVIDAANQSSIRFHEKQGFSYSGTLKEVGFKFGKWLDIAFYQLVLETPADPVEG